MFLCGFVGAVALPSAYYGEGSGPIVLDEVACTGVESSLIECDRHGLGSHNCVHSEDSSVICEGNLVCIHIIP